MNDLTKEEIAWLKDELKYGVENYSQPDIAYKIIEKLQSMLHMLCEECHGKRYIDNMCDGAPGCCNYPCSNCVVTE